eukprot:scaffold122000_cov47-Attheya_sp.AAC.1
MVIFFVGLGCGTVIAVGEREICARCADGCKCYGLEGFLCDYIRFGLIPLGRRNYVNHGFGWFCCNWSFLISAVLPVGCAF